MQRALHVVSHRLFEIRVDILLVGHFEQFLKLLSCIIELFLLFVVFHESPGAVERVVGVADVAVGSIGRCGRIAGMVGLHSEELVFVVVADIIRNLNGVGQVTYLLEFPPSGLVRDVCVVAIYEAGFDSFSHIAVVSGPEHNMCGLSGVVRIDIIYPFRHGRGSFELESHRLISHDGLSSPCLAFGHILSCSLIIEVV